MNLRDALRITSFILGLSATALFAAKPESTPPDEPVHQLEPFVINAKADGVLPFAVGYGWNTRLGIPTGGLGYPLTILKPARKDEKWTPHVLWKLNQRYRPISHLESIASINIPAALTLKHGAQVLAIDGHDMEELTKSDLDEIYRGKSDAAGSNVILTLRGLGPEQNIFREISVDLISTAKYKRLLNEPQAPEAAAPALADLPAVKNSPKRNNLPACFRSLTFEQATALAALESKPLVLYFDGYWHKKSGAFLRDLATYPKVHDLLAHNTVALHLDVLDHPELCQNYHIPYAPSLIVLSPQGMPVKHLFGTPVLRMPLAQKLNKNRDNRWQSIEGDFLHLFIDLNSPDASKLKIDPIKRAENHLARGNFTTAYELITRAKTASDSVDAPDRLAIVDKDTGLIEDHFVLTLLLIASLHPPANELLTTSLGDLERYLRQKPKDLHASNSYLKICSRGQLARFESFAQTLPENSVIRRWMRENWMLQILKPKASSDADQNLDHSKPAKTP